MWKSIRHKIRHPQKKTTHVPVGTCNNGMTRVHKSEAFYDRASDALESQAELAETSSVFSSDDSAIETFDGPAPFVLTVSDSDTPLLSQKRLNQARPSGRRLQPTYIVPHVDRFVDNIRPRQFQNSQTNSRYQPEPFYPSGDTKAMVKYFEHLHKRNLRKASQPKAPQKLPKKTHLSNNNNDNNKKMQPPTSDHFDPLKDFSCTATAEAAAKKMLAGDSPYDFSPKHFPHLSTSTLPLGTCRIPDSGVFDNTLLRSYTDNSEDTSMMDAEVINGIHELADKILSDLFQSVEKLGAEVTKAADAIFLSDMVKKRKKEARAFAEQYDEYFGRINSTYGPGYGHYYGTSND